MNLLIFIPFPLVGGWNY